LIAERSHRSRWGWKDPRTALFLDFSTGRPIPFCLSAPDRGPVVAAAARRI
jgi:hypothetical protein